MKTTFKCKNPKCKYTNVLENLTFEYNGYFWECHNCEQENFSFKCTCKKKHTVKPGKSGTRTCECGKIIWIPITIKQRRYPFECPECKIQRFTFIGYQNKDDYCKACNTSIIIPEYTKDERTTAELDQLEDEAYDSFSTLDKKSKKELSPYREIALKFVNRIKTFFQYSFEYLPNKEKRIYTFEKILKTLRSIHSTFETINTEFIEKEIHDTIVGLMKYNFNKQLALAKRLTGLNTDFEIDTEGGNPKFRSPKIGEYYVNPTTKKIEKYNADGKAGVTSTNYIIVKKSEIKLKLSTQVAKSIDDLTHEEIEDDLENGNLEIVGDKEGNVEVEVDDTVESELAQILESALEGNGDDIIITEPDDADLPQQSIIEEKEKKKKQPPKLLPPESIITTNNDTFEQKLNKLITEFVSITNDDSLETNERAKRLKNLFEKLNTAKPEEADLQVNYANGTLPIESTIKTFLKTIRKGLQDILNEYGHEEITNSFGITETTIGDLIEILGESLNKWETDINIQIRERKEKKQRPQLHIIKTQTTTKSAQAKTTQGETQMNTQTLQQKIKELTEENNRLKQKFAKLEKTHELSEKENAKKIRDLKEENDKLKQEIEEAQKEPGLSEEVGQLKEQVSTLEVELNSAKSSIDKALQNMGGLEAIEEHFEKITQKLEKEIKEIKKNK